MRCYIRSRQVREIPRTTSLSNVQVVELLLIEVREIPRTTSLSNLKYFAVLRGYTGSQLRHSKQKDYTAFVKIRIRRHR